MSSNFCNIISKYPWVDDTWSIENMLRTIRINWFYAVCIGKGRIGILGKDLGIHAYKINLTQNLKPHAHLLCRKSRSRYLKKWAYQLATEILQPNIAGPFSLRLRKVEGLCYQARDNRSARNRMCDNKTVW